MHGVAVRRLASFRRQVLRDGVRPHGAAYGKEEIFDHIPGRERPTAAVGVLETRKPPTPEAIAYLAEKLQLPASRLTLLAVPTASIAGTVQVVARALETALHKLYELKFDLTQVVSGVGVAPLPPVAADDVTGIGRTNDAILYGGRATLSVRRRRSTRRRRPRRTVVGVARSRRPLRRNLRALSRDFYKIDPLLFSPAEIVFHNLRTGRSHTFGRMAPEVLKKSFFGVAPL